MTKEYRRPILSRIFDILGALCFIVGGLSIVFSFLAATHDSETGGATAFAGLGSGAIAIVVGLIYIGIGQAIDYLGRTAYNTGFLKDLVAETRAGAAATSAALAKVATSKQARGKFYYSAGQSNEGPFDAEGMRDLILAGTVLSTTPVIREGDKEWGNIRTYPELG